MEVAPINQKQKERCIILSLNAVFTITPASNHYNAGNLLKTLKQGS
ncbi:MAG: hypothetical protein ACTSVI_17480 [Promethearchaeota archaeon]